MGDAADDPRPPDRHRRDRAAIFIIAAYLVIAATGWYLLKELAPVLRPLALAVFLAYIIIPVQARLARRTSRAVALVVLGLAALGVCGLLAALTYDSAVDLSADLPRFAQRGKATVAQVRSAVDQWPWLHGLVGDPEAAIDRAAGKLNALIGTIAGTAADVLSEGLVVGVYLLFLLLEAAHFPGRIRAGFAAERSGQILSVVAQINSAIASYLRVKVLASLILAVPATLILWAFGVKAALLWGVLTFLLNFVPYVGSAVAWTLPTLLAFLQLDPGWQPIAVASLLLADHSLSAYVIEPALTGKAVDLSPLVILLALAFWGLCWGLEGMLLAVPLTVVLRIVLDHLAATRPLARLMGEG
jgi:AI-2 transport protein TqsA